MLIHKMKGSDSLVQLIIFVFFFLVEKRDMRFKISLGEQGRFWVVTELN